MAGWVQVESPEVVEGEAHRRPASAVPQQQQQAAVGWLGDIRKALTGGPVCAKVVRAALYPARIYPARQLRRKRCWWLSLTLQMLVPLYGPHGPSPPARA